MITVAHHAAGANRDPSRQRRERALAPNGLDSIHSTALWRCYYEGLPRSTTRADRCTASLWVQETAGSNPAILTKSAGREPVLAWLRRLSRSFDRHLTVSLNADQQCWLSRIGPHRHPSYARWRFRVNRFAGSLARQRPSGNTPRIYP